MKDTYQRKKTANNLYEVLGADGKILKNHNNKEYPNLSDNISKNLVEDLNAINEKNSDVIFKNNSEEDAIMEMALHNLSNIELNESLCYCLISTLMEYQDAEQIIELEIEPQIQWDRLFRFNPGPPLLLMELKNTTNARDFFGDDYARLPLNYCNSIEEMEENEAEFVRKEIIKKVSDIVQEMSLAEKVMVDILYNLYDFFSITLPILWVAGKIGDEDFIAAYYALNKEIDIYEMDEEEFEVPRFEVNRLFYLKTIIYGYRWKDETLPDVNY